MLVWARILRKPYGAGGSPEYLEGGRQHQTHRPQGLWDRALSTKLDYMLIQFGPKDQETPEPLDRQVPIADCEANLRRYVLEARAEGIKPVLVTPLTRRYFELIDGNIHSGLTLQSETMERMFYMQYMEDNFRHRFDFPGQRYMDHRR